jgi:ribonuclease G
MEKKILILKENNEIWTYILEDNEIVEIHYDEALDNAKGSHQVGNIYIGKVKKILKNIGAAFVEIEPGLECYYDLSQADTAIFTTKVGKKSLSIADELVVQLSKEGMKSKGPTVTSEISFTGYYSVLTTGNTRIGVSAKVPKGRSEELKGYLVKYQNEEYGIIIRTNGGYAPLEVIEEEIERHIRTLNELKFKATMRTCFSVLQRKPPNYITDILNVAVGGLSKILVNDKELYDEIVKYCKPFNTLPELIQLVEEKNTSLAAVYNTRKVLERALDEKVWLKSGAYLVIQPTEALTVIDVNSGKYEKKESDREATLKINCEAAKEIAKQLRLRNISGIIIVDFINMEDEEDLISLVKELKGQLAKDSVKTTFVGITKLQLIEITRKKIRKPLSETLTLTGKRVRVNTSQQRC